MNVPVDMNRLPRPARAYLRAVADGSTADTRMDHAARVLAGCRIGFAEKSSALAEASVRRKLHKRRFALGNVPEVAALHRFVVMAVRRLDDEDLRGRADDVQRELHRFARVHHLPNILKMHEGAA